MPEELHVDPEGLRTGAAVSDGLSGLLAAGVSGRVGGGQDIHAAVRAVDAAVAATRDDQSGRLGEQVEDLRTGAARYDGSDEASARNIARSM